MGKYKPKRKLSAGEKKLFNLQKKSTITRGKSINSLDPDKLRDVGYTKKPESTIEKPPTLTGRVDQTKGSPAPKRTTFKPENQFNSYNPLDEEMMNQEPAKARKRYKKNKPKRIISDAEKKIFSRQKPGTAGRFNQTTGKPKSTYDRSGLDTSRIIKDIKPKKGEVIDEDRKTFDKYMKDARDKKAEDKLPLLRKATKIHKELPDEDKK